jgi:hypothetical protein
MSGIRGILTTATLLPQLVLFLTTPTQPQDLKRVWWWSGTGSRVAVVSMKKCVGEKLFDEWGRGEDG